MPPIRLGEVALVLCFLGNLVSLPNTSCSFILEAHLGSKSCDFHLTQCLFLHLTFRKVLLFNILTKQLCGCSSGSLIIAIKEESLTINCFKIQLMIGFQGWADNHNPFLMAAYIYLVGQRQPLGCVLG